MLLSAWWWMFWTPGSASVGHLQPVNADALRLESQLRHDVEFLARSVGERNIPDKTEQLEQAAQFIDSSLRAAGHRPQSQWYNIGSAKCRNIEAEIRGAGRPG